MSDAPDTSAPAPAPAPRRMGVGLIWAAIYGVIALVFAGAAAYMHVVKAAPLMQPQVSMGWAPLRFQRNRRRTM